MTIEQLDKEIAEIEHQLIKLSGALEAFKFMKAKLAEVKE